jgi:hypothetical protein
LKRAVERLALKCSLTIVIVQKLQMFVRDRERERISAITLWPFDFSMSDNRGVGSLPRGTLILVKQMLALAI